MENKEHNEDINEQGKEHSNKKDCCSVFATYNEQGQKKPSSLVYAILGVVLIGGIGIVTSNKENQRELVKNTNEQAFQLQKESDLIQAQVAKRNKTQKSNKVAETSQEQSVISKMKEMQDAHNKQMQQAQKTFEALKISYAQKLNEVVKTMESQQEAKQQDIPNPELNFQLRGLSNIRVQFNNKKDISYLEIIQPEDCKSYGDKKKDKSNYYPKKDKGCDDKGNKNWGDCKPMQKMDCETSKCYPMPVNQKEYKNYNKWDCESKWDSKPKDKQYSDCY